MVCSCAFRMRRQRIAAVVSANRSWRSMGLELAIPHRRHSRLACCFSASSSTAFILAFFMRAFQVATRFAAILAAIHAGSSRTSSIFKGAIPRRRIVPSGQPPGAIHSSRRKQCLRIVASSYELDTRCKGGDGRMSLNSGESTLALEYPSSDAFDLGSRASVLTSVLSPRQVGPADARGAEIPAVSTASTALGCRARGVAGASTSKSPSPYSSQSSAI
ncbi:hypothetical protein H310_02906 [Aphanomyces invadans]|uniref:Uncharacterized protein n=1 Tax=Aphanomyces invadans TaxID=157072 RepID=A0A024UJW1_9STRA|nr:hypothetical protein H310_02906 [Aphanomyces invadans]ETW06741.1 hypothetical protein H310_02906 [Aphanomyces invadans]|eukprot:XP_008864816.1 hypothetical protein H310_02906 [Aphanomyces invadans]